MSKLSDYSKFNHLDSSDSDGDGVGGDERCPDRPTNPPLASPRPPAAPAPAPSRGVTRKHPTIADRYVFSHGSRKVYEWEQSLEEVTVYIDAPTDRLPRVRAADALVVNITPTRLQVGLKGADRYFVDEETFDKVKPKESSWFLDEGVLTIVLAKCFRGQTWEGVLRGHDAEGDANDGGSSGGRRGIRESVDPFVKQEMQRTLMLERFQEENPGFDFRDATFNGEVPDPQSFMGGVGYDH
ncbi:hypothetical protein ACHAWF_013644 [Thalassiosira exigua]